jgi:glycerol-1-phosphate dehydrogenase [NAD(P)+]
MKFSGVTQNRFLTIPKVLKILSGETAELIKQIITAFNDSENNCVTIASGPGKSKEIAHSIGSALMGSFEVRYCEIIDNTIEQAVEVDKLCAQTQSSILIAVGGGKVIDVCKVSANKRKIDFAVLPTCLSSDCITSPVAVIKESGKTKSIAAALADFVFIDLNLISSAPERLNLSGLGDLISNISAILDWDYAAKVSNTHIDDFAKLLSISSCNALIKNNSFKCSNIADLKLMAEGLLISGLSMGFSGDSRPASGAEHLISHAIDKLGYGNGLHGEQVTITSVFMNALRKLLNEDTFDQEVSNFIKDNGLKNKPKHISISQEEFLEAVTISQGMRPDRITVLNHPDLTENILKEAYLNAFI